MSQNQHQPWTPAEEEILRHVYATASKEEALEALPARTWSAISQHGKDLKVIRTFTRRSWTEAENRILTDQYAENGPRVMAERLNRSVFSISVRASQLNVIFKSRPQQWTAADKALMLAHYSSGMPLKELAALMGKKPNTLPAYAKFIGIRREVMAKKAYPAKRKASRTTRYNAWPTKHVEILKRDYPNLGADHVAALVGREPGTVTAMAGRLKLRRNSPNLTRWSDEHRALVEQHYPAGMPLSELAELVGRKMGTVMAYCVDNGIKRQVRANKAKPASAPKPPRQPKAAPPKVAREAKPRPAARAIEPKPAQPPKEPRLRIAKPKPAKVPKLRTEKPPRPAPEPRQPKMPNLMAQKAKRERATTVQVAITAEEIRKLPYNHPGRLAYMQNGIRGWESYLRSHANQSAL